MFIHVQRKSHNKRQIISHSNKKGIFQSCHFNCFRIIIIWPVKRIVKFQLILFSSNAIRKTLSLYFALINCLFVSFLCSAASFSNVTPSSHIWILRRKESFSGIMPCTPYFRNFHPRGFHIQLCSSSGMLLELSFRKCDLIDLYLLYVYNNI